MTRNEHTTVSSPTISGSAAARPPRKKKKASTRQEREREHLGAAEIAVDLIADLLAGDRGAAERHARHGLEAMGRAGDDVGLVGGSPQRRGDQRRRPVRGDERAPARPAAACSRRPRPERRPRMRATCVTRSRPVRARRAAWRVDHRDDPGRAVEAAGLLDRLPRGDRRRAGILEPVGGVELTGDRAAEDRGDDEGRRAAPIRILRGRRMPRSANALSMSGAPCWTGRERLGSYERRRGASSACATNFSLLPRQYATPLVLPRQYARVLPWPDDGAPPGRYFDRRDERAS